MVLDTFKGKERRIEIPSKVYSQYHPHETSHDDLIESGMAVIDPSILEQLEKLLPVLNGLLYMSKANRSFLLENDELVQALFKIF
jgi:23S rRNA A2030 N6-methylase RlmJ